MDEKPPLAMQAAKASWVAPLVAAMLGIVVAAMTGNSKNVDVETARTIRLIVSVIAIAIAASGLPLGFAALFGMRRHGTKGILIPSMIGILLSSGYLYLVVSAILEIRKMANVPD